MLCKKTDAINPHGIYNRCPVCRDLYLLVICITGGEAKPLFYHQVCSWCEEQTPVPVNQQLYERRRVKRGLSRKQTNAVHRIREDASRVFSSESEN